MPDVPDARRKAAVRELDFHWGEAYVIFSGDGVYSATRLDDRRVLTAGSPDELREKIRKDYDARPVPRECVPDGRS